MPRRPAGQAKQDENPVPVPIACALPDYADRLSHTHRMACPEAQKPALMLVAIQLGTPRSPKAFGT